MPHELLKSEVQIIASSEYNFKVELILDIGREDIPDLIETSKCLVDIFGDRALLNKNNIYKYFSKDTLPFVARYKRGYYRIYYWSTTRAFFARILVTF